jgi:hypothetical protein
LTKLAGGLALCRHHGNAPAGYCSWWFAGHQVHTSLQSSLCQPHGCHAVFSSGCLTGFIQQPEVQLMGAAGAGASAKQTHSQGRIPCHPLPGRPAAAPIQLQQQVPLAPTAAEPQSCNVQGLQPQPPMAAPVQEQQQQQRQASQHHGSGACASHTNAQGQQQQQQASQQRSSRLASSAAAG